MIVLSPWLHSGPDMYIDTAALHREVLTKHLTKDTVKTVRAY